MAPTDEQGRKRRLFRKTLVALLILFFLSALAFILLLLFFPRERIWDYIESRVAGQLNEQVKIYMQSTSYIPPSRFIIKDVVVDDQRTSLREFQAKEIDFYVNLFSIFNGESPVSRVLLKAPVVDLVRTESGDWNVENIIKPSEKPAEEEKQPSLGSIIIRDGSVQIFRQDGEKLVSVDDISATVHPAEDLIHLKSASLSRHPISAEFEGSISGFMARQLQIDIETKGEILRTGSTVERGARSPRNQQVLNFSATGKGPLNNIFIDGTFSVDKEAFSRIPINGSLHGNLDSPKGALAVNRLQTNIGDSALALSGAASDIWSESRSANLSGNAQVLLEQVLSATSKSLARQLEPEGVARGKVTFTATGEKIDFAGAFNIEPVGVTIPRVMRKEKGTPGAFTAEGSYTYGQALTIDDFDLTINGAPITGAARINSATEPSTQLSFQAAEFPLEHLNRLPAVAFSSGVVTAKGMITKSTPEAEGVQYRTDATIANASMVGGALKEPIRNLDAEMNLQNQKLTVQSSRFSFADSEYRAQGELINFSAPQVEGSLQANTMNLPAIISAMRGNKSEEKKDETQPSGGALQKTTLNMIIKADSVYTGKFSTGPMSGALTSSGQIYNFSPVTVNLFDGELRANSQFVSAENRVEWQVDFEGAGINLEKFLKDLQQGEPKLTGLLDINGNLRGSASGNTEEILRSITGQVKVSAKDGKVIRNPVLSTIINLTQIPVASLLVPGLREAVIANTLLNLFKTEGRSLDISSVAYTKLEGIFAFSDGKASTEDMRFRSGIIDLISTGSINYVDRTVDFRVKATPLGALSSLVSKIPIAGGPIRGAKEAVFATDFLVTGSLTNPEVRPAIVGDILGGREEAGREK